MLYKLNIVIVILFLSSASIFAQSKFSPSKGVFITSDVLLLQNARVEYGVGYRFGENFNASTSFYDQGNGIFYFRVNGSYRNYFFKKETWGYEFGAGIDMPNKFDDRLEGREIGYELTPSLYRKIQVTDWFDVYPTIKYQSKIYQSYSASSIVISLPLAFKVFNDSRFIFYPSIENFAGIGSSRNEGGLTFNFGFNF